MKLSAAGEALDRVLAEIRETRADADQLNEELAQVPPREFNLKDVRALNATPAERREDYRQRLRADVPTARQALKQLLGDKPIRLVPIRTEGRKDFGSVVKRALEHCSRPAFGFDWK